MTDAGNGDDSTKVEHEIVRDVADTKAAGEVIATVGRSSLKQAIAGLAGVGGFVLGGPAGLIAAPAAAALMDGLFAAVDRNDAGRKAIGVVQDVEAVRALSARVGELQARFEVLETQGAGPTAGDVAAVLSMYLDTARSAADERKRRLLTNAVVNAFDPTLYEAGLTRTLFAILARLDYPEVYLLRKIDAQAAKATPPEKRGRVLPMSEDTRWKPWLEAWSLDAMHATRLVDEGLVLRTGDERGHAHVSTADVTELGRRMLALAAEPKASDAREARDEDRER